MANLNAFFSFLILLLLASAGSISVQDLDRAPLSGYTCNHPPYTVHLFSKAPLVIYISNFLTPEESSHLQEIRFSSQAPDTTFLSIFSSSFHSLTPTQQRHLHPICRLRRVRSSRPPPDPHLPVHQHPPRRHCPLHRDARPLLPRLRRTTHAPRASATRAVRPRRDLSPPHRLVLSRSANDRRRRRQPPHLILRLCRGDQRHGRRHELPNLGCATG
jgi:hypothetical protein